MRIRRVRPSCVVLSPRRWGQVNGDAIAALRPKRIHPFATVAKEPEHRGERRVSRKAIAQGMPDDSALPDELVGVFLFSPRGLRVRPAPGIPCALFTSKGARLSQNPGAIAPRECGGVSLRCHAPRKRGIQYPRGFSAELWRLWNTGSPGQAGRRHRMLFDILNPGETANARPRNRAATSSSRRPG
jgi:hypothetical protein